MSDASTLGDLVARGELLLNDGYRTRADQLGVPGIPILRVADVLDGQVLASYRDHIRDEYRPKMGAKVSQAGDVLITTKGTVGRVAAVPRGFPPHAYSPQLCFLRSTDSEALDPDWLYQWARSPQMLEQIGLVKDQTDMAPYVSLTDLRRVEIEVPELSEQRRIAGVLGALDDLIETNRHLARALEDQILALFADEGFDSEPNGESMSLSELVEVNPKLTRPAGETAYVDMAALPTDSSRIGTVARRPAAGGARFQNGDTLLARLTPCLENGKAAFVDILAPGETAVGSTEFLVLRDRGTVGPHWPYALVRSERFRDYAIRQMNGSSGRQRCSADSVERYQLAPPAPDAVDRFRTAAAAAFDAIGSLNDEIDDLTRVRDELLPLLVSGRVRVREVA